MARELINTAGISRDEWLGLRKRGIGGSEAAAVLGISPWATPVTVWLDKTGRAEPKEETESMLLGRELEDFVARRYATAAERKVERYNKMIVDGIRVGNFDRLVVKPGEKVASHMGEIRTDTLLECKTSSREWTDGVPLYYQTQVQHYMGLAPELQHADVAVLFLGRKHFETYRIERDDEIIAVMAERIDEWWKRYVATDTAPEPTNEEDCKLLWARSNPGKKVMATAEVEAAVKELAEAKAAEAAAKDKAAEIQSRICAAMGDGEVLTDPSGKPLVTWKSTKDTVKTNWQGLAWWIWKSNHMNELPPEFVEKFSETKPGARRFVIKAAV